MKSNVCKIEKGKRGLEVILKESERVAEYNGLTHKQTLQLRLLCEEMGGMLPNIIDKFEGDFWIEYENGVCKVNASLKIPQFNADKKEGLIDVASNKKNAAAVGIVGKIRNAIENIFLEQDSISAFGGPSGAYGFAMGYGEHIDYSCMWTLDGYRSTVKNENHTEAWDELEKSVIASVADDVIVGVKGNKADIIIVKKFS